MRKLAFLSLLLFGTSINAQQFVAANQKPTGVHIAPGHGILVFHAIVTSGTKPSCAGDNRWSIKTDTPGAKELISMVIAAKVSDRTITVHGDGNCDSSGWGYKISYMYLN